MLFRLVGEDCVIERNIPENLNIDFHKGIIYKNIPSGATLFVKPNKGGFIYVHNVFGTVEGTKNQDEPKWRLLIATDEIEGDIFDHFSPEAKKTPFMFCWDSTKYLACLYDKNGEKYLPF